MPIREATLEDYDAIMGVQRRNGLSTPTREQWNSLWLANPCRRAGGSFPIGWVLQDDTGQVVGALANIPLAYEWRGKPLRAAASGSWAVDPGHRRHSLRLLTQFVRQPDMDLLLTTTANSISHDALLLLKARRVPQAEYHDVLYWITDYPRLAGYVLKRSRLPGAAVLARPAGLAVRIWDRIRGINRGTAVSGHVERLSAFQGCFDEFWDELRRRRADTLLAVRHAAALRWHFMRTAPVIFGIRTSGRLTGYLIATPVDDERTGLRRLRVADCQVLEREEEHLEALLCAALEHARRERIDVLEIIGFAKSKRRVFETLRPRRRRLPSFPFVYKAIDSRFEAELAGADAWDPSPFDGDASLW